MSQIEIVYQGEAIDEESLRNFNPDDVYRAVNTEIVYLQNENYADDTAAMLQAWLGDFVVKFWGSGS